MLKDSKSLEVSCYVLGAGAFGVFARWMQLQMAYNDENLPDASVWNVLVILLIVAAAFVFHSFLRKYDQKSLSLPEDFFEVLKNEGKIYSFASWFIGIIMIAGSVLLFTSCELDLNVIFLRISAVLGVLTGISFPLLLSCANRPHATKRTTITLLSIIPIIFFAEWLLTSYKQNSINPVHWDYVVEIITIIVSMFAFFRVAGFAYCVPSGKRSMFLCMLGSMLCIMSIADPRYLGQQVMLAGASLMMAELNWIMVANMKQGEKKIFSEVTEDSEGFEHLS